MSVQIATEMLIALKTTTVVVNKDSLEMGATAVPKVLCHTAVLQCSLFCIQFS